MLKLFRRSLPPLVDRSIDELKPVTSILFVDDDEFRVVDILKTHGWSHTHLITDIDNLDDERIRNAHIIFVDIHGVGAALGFEDEGLGLVAALKAKYPEKRIVVYSAESSGDRFNENLLLADARLRKNADPFEFLTLVEEYSLEMFSATQCVRRVQKILRREFGMEISREQIEHLVQEVGKKRDFSPEFVGRLFNVQNAGGIASILSLFWGPFAS